MSARTLLAGAFVFTCLGLTACTGRQILSMRSHPEQPSASVPAPAPSAPFTGPALAATTDYPKNPNAPRPEPPADYANLKDPLSATSGNLAGGKQLFDANCAPCHGTDGAGDGPAASALNPRPADFRTAIHAKLPDGYYFWRVTRGGSVAPFSAAGSAMPPWEGSLTPQQRWLVILYVKSFSAPAK
ncbi:MAG TPA: cytochrome c [bacterium]|nr:cytochrome c [bacterium]